ncbi:sigma factor [Streptomyces nitrosporeus]|uniref:RNA polymerase subunit sigma-70 n=1 Tax=Streptomyces nitrosporeus TaxID=28894 RepID=A0A5J6F9Q3_9ACTN|nr:sigma factor [Streptomyces nitrosporeus]QEU73002.1 RNA polymerase subunit sigma-70 [Streptomyces nitrosporeus]
MVKDAPPRWDRRMQQRLARGEAAALCELYDRFAPLVHSQAHRMLDDEDAADLVTREVFGSVWENPDAYDPREGPMRSWVADLTHRKAVEQLRAAHGEAGDGDGGAHRREFEHRVRKATSAARADYIVASMPASLRAALELAYVRRRDYRQAAEDLGVTDDEARRRLRLGLQLLSTANPVPPEEPVPPGYGAAP